MTNGRMDGRMDGRTNNPEAICPSNFFEVGGIMSDFVCVEVLRPSQPNGVMSSTVSLPNHTFTGQA